MLRSRKFFTPCAIRFLMEKVDKRGVPDTRTKQRIIQTGLVIANERLCREHWRVTFRLGAFESCKPGQFVHLSPEPQQDDGYLTHDAGSAAGFKKWEAVCSAPILRRAFSIAGLKRESDGVHIEVIYRVVGAATRWMASLQVNDRLSVLGPLGNTFPVNDEKSSAWLVAGGVGLPPMIWLAEALHAAGKRNVAFCGAQSADLLALDLDPNASPACDASHAVDVCPEFTRSGASVVVSTDDGSLGYHGHIGAAMRAYHEANPIPFDDVVVYTCGPEPMMRFVAEYALAHDMECHVCMERSMACGAGMCQSCVVPVRDDDDADRWSYRLCCTDGPVFDAARILW